MVPKIIFNIEHGSVWKTISSGSGLETNIFLRLVLGGNMKIVICWAGNETLVGSFLVGEITKCLATDCNRTWTHNHLGCKPLSLAKCLSVHLQTKLLWVWVPLQSLKLQILCLFWAMIFSTFRQLQSVDSLWNMYVIW